MSASEPANLMSFYHMGVLAFLLLKTHGRRKL